MYCKKCGKQIDYSDICYECQDSQILNATPANKPAASASVPTEANGSKKTGMKFGLTATILAGISLILAATMLLFIPAVVDELTALTGSTSIQGNYYVTYYVDPAKAQALGAIFLMYSLACTALLIPSFINAARGCATFVSELCAGKVKPIVTIILSGIGLVLSVIALFVCVNALSMSIGFLNFYA